MRNALEYYQLQSIESRSAMNQYRIDQELIEAVQENNLPEVVRLWRAGADVNAKDAFDRTPLHWACYNDHSQVAKELLEHGADTEAKAVLGWTPLHLAAINGHLAVLIELLNLNDSNGTTTTILGKRTSRGGADIEVKDNQGNTPLHKASLNNHLPVVKALLAVGANFLAANNFGELPIRLALQKGHSAVAKCLLQQIYSTTRHLPLHELLEDVTWIGDPYSSSAPPLRLALHRRNMLGTDDVVEIIEYLVDRDPALLRSRDLDGSLPLHVACRRGVSFNIVQSLIDLYEASVKSLTPEGALPLFLACEIPEPSLDIIFLLMKLYPDLVYR
jgi:ankyrin repeat protein